VKAAVHLEHQILSIESEHDVHAMIELTVPEAAGAATRPPLRLALVLDRSGSMTGAKLAVAQRCAAWLAGRLRPQDEFALVSFDDEVRLVAPLAPVNGALRNAIASLRPGGSTNLSGGWLKGLEQLRPAPADGVRKILLLTDGLANVGINDPSALAQLAKTAAGERIGTTTIGIGSDFDEELLTRMADAGGGNAHYAETADAAPGIFSRELDGLTQVAAQNVSIEIRPVAQVQVLGILNDYPHVAVPGGVQVALGDAYAGETRRVVLELHVPYLAALGPAPVAEIVLRYVSVGSQIEQHELTIPLAVNLVSSDEAAASAPDLAVRGEVLVLKAARARDEAIRLADAGENEQAMRLISGAESQLRCAGMSDEADALADELPLLEHVVYSADPASRKRLHFESHKRKRGQ
jgi:Ca-activated chloride channel family protein